MTSCSCPVAHLILGRPPEPSELFKNNSIVKARYLSFHIALGVLPQVYCHDSASQVFLPTHAGLSLSPPEVPKNHFRITSCYDVQR